MAADLMAGYMAYTTASHILADAYNGSAEPDVKSVSVTLVSTATLPTTSISV